jgi:hypothetical protein
MNETRTNTPQRPRAARRAPLAALALLSLLAGAIASGCIYNYDPRDSSRLDSPGTPGAVELRVA